MDHDCYLEKDCGICHVKTTAEEDADEHKVYVNPHTMVRYHVSCIEREKAAVMEAQSAI